ncbi:MAG: hypothetical protein ACK4V1_08055 [Burkholderiaceae bacterium]
MALLTSLWNILVARDLAIEVAMLAAIATRPDHTRHQLAALARSEIAQHLGVAVESRQPPFRPAPATADTTPARSRAAARSSR